MGLLAGAAPAFASDKGSCAPADMAALAGWEGIWMAEGLSSDINGRSRPDQESFRPYSKFQGFDAPWNEEGRRRFKEAQIDLDKVDQGGWGFPVMMTAPTPFEITIGRGKTTMTGEYRDIRVIYTDGRGHDADGWPTIYGDSIGCWHGDTLKAETTMVHYTPEFNKLAATLSDNAVFEETYRLTAPDRLELDAVITDPETLTKPWVVHVNYLKHKILDRIVIEGALEQNNRVEQIDGQYTIKGIEGGLAGPDTDDSAKGGK